MKKLTRFSLSIENSLLKKFEEEISKKGYKNRSQAISDLIRKDLVKQEWGRGNKEVVGTITLVYNHHQRTILNRLLNLQHNFHKAIISTTHIHLDKENCLEVLVVKGKPNKIKEIADKLTSIKGIKYGELSTATTGKDLT
ncbi:MAG: nickel-responsive transcriptional regulator NikR [Patescibacteria group bacterium]